MAIDLEKALRKQKLQTSGREQFKFETPGDQIIARIRALRTFQKTDKDGKVRYSFTVDCDFLGGEKIVDGKITHVKPSRGFFYLQTDSKRIYDAENLGPGDVWLLRLVAIRKDLNNMKEYQYEILERVAHPEANGPVPPDDDDVPEFPLPAKD